MTELEAAKEIAAGRLPSPHKFGEMTLFAVRVTGTGMAYRDGLKEYVWRDPSLYLNNDFLERVAGLPLLWEHPVKGSLNSKEFNDRIIGSLMFGYINGEDVWGIARVYDAEAIQLMTDGQLSTSPGVVFKAGDGNVSGETPDGNNLLIEGLPSILDHLAVCAAGVWDKGGDPTGVLNDTLPTSTQEPASMAEEHEEKAAADKARSDASEKLDAIMDAFKKMDARLDAMEMDKKCDSARKDKFGKRKDGESYADYSKRHDAEEKEYADAIRNINDAMSEDDCMDKARKDRKDAEEEEKRHDKDFEKWAKEEEEEPEHKEDKKRKDAEEKFEGARDSKKDARKDSEESDEKKDARKDADEEMMDARKDSALAKENAEIKSALAALQRQMKTITAEVNHEERDALAAAQARADSVFAMLGDRAGPPNPGESSLEYRRRLLKKLAPRSTRWKNTRFDSLTSDVIVPVEDQVYADAASSARSINDAQVGTLIPYEERDRSGRLITKYHGDIGAFLAPFIPHEAIVGRINNKPHGA